MLGGLAELGPVDPFAGDLTLELGLSVWLRRSGTSLLEARERLFEARRAILSVCGLDPATEPVPLVGRSPCRHPHPGRLRRRSLAPRAATRVGACGWWPSVPRAELPERQEEALGA